MTLLAVRRRAADWYAESGCFRLLVMVAIVVTNLLGLQAICLMPASALPWQPVLVIGWTALLATAATWFLLPPLE